jgi:hypothetical protein
MFQQGLNAQTIEAALRQQQEEWVGWPSVCVKMAMTSSLP